MSIGKFWFVCAVCILAFPAWADKETSGTLDGASQPGLDEMRITMDKWIETQQIISKERNDWQQGKEILQGRLDLVEKEIATLKEEIARADTGVKETDVKRKELLAENESLQASSAQLTEAATALEQKIRGLYKRLPDPIRTKLQPLYERIPANAAATRVSIAERFQNILGILNELNKSNNEITVNYEIHNLADGKPSEVQAFYIGLAQAYYVSARGEAGIGRPSADGWKWTPSSAAAADILTALEILQGKHSPAFVPLPVELQ